MKKVGEVLLILFGLVPFPLVGGVAGFLLGGMVGLAVGLTLGRSILLLVVVGLLGGAIGGRQLALYLARKQEEKRQAEDVMVIEDISDSLPGEHVLGLTVMVERPLTDLFMYVTSLENYPQWHIVTLSMQRLSAEPMGVGAVYEHHLRGGNGRSAHLQITAYEPNRTLAYRYLNAPDFTYQSVRYDFATTETGTKMTAVVELSAVERQSYLLSAQRISIWRDLFTLKKLLEPAPTPEQ
ncbi:MAG: SRPBCC family protein [Anaerolineales bacterium]|nr:SRPBCC family protein [Anaerolineales bacterium]